MIGDVCTRSVYLKDGVISKAPDRCEVLGVSRLLSRLLMEAVDLPVACEADERANHIMQLILIELRSASNCLCAFRYPPTRGWHRSADGSWRSRTRGTRSTIGRPPCT
jgi:hypothetical protein